VISPSQSLLPHNSQHSQQKDRHPCPPAGFDINIFKVVLYHFFLRFPDFFSRHRESESLTFLGTKCDMDFLRTACWKIVVLYREMTREGLDPTEPCPFSVFFFFNIFLQMNLYSFPLAAFPEAFKIIFRLLNFSFFPYLLYAPPILIFLGLFP